MNTIRMLLWSIPALVSLSVLIAWLTQNKLLLTYHSSSPTQLANALLLVLSIIIGSKFFKNRTNKILISAYILYIIYEILSLSGWLPSSSALILGDRLIIIENQDKPGVLSPQSLFMHSAIALYFSYFYRFNSNRTNKILPLGYISFLISLPLSSWIYRVFDEGTALDFVTFTRFGAITEITLILILFNILLDLGIFSSQHRADYVPFSASSLILGVTIFTRVPHILNKDVSRDVQFWFDAFSIASVVGIFYISTAFYIKYFYENLSLQSALKDLQKHNNESEIMISSLGHDIVPPIRLINNILKDLPTNGNVRQIPIDTLTQIRAKLFSIADTGSKIISYLTLDKDIKGNYKRPAKFPLETLIQEMKLELENHYNTKLSIDCINCDELLLVPPHLFSILLQNLLSNSIKYSTYSKICEVRVAIKSECNFLTVIVDDLGPGIPEEDVEIALQPRKRLTTSSDGTGMGLSIVSQIVNLFDGEISFYHLSGPKFKFRAVVKLKVESNN